MSFVKNQAFFWLNTDDFISGAAF